VFLEFFLSILSGYRSFLSSWGGDARFNFDPFVVSQPAEVRRVVVLLPALTQQWLRVFQQSQMWEVFMRERVAMAFNSFKDPGPFEDAVTRISKVIEKSTKSYTSGRFGLPSRPKLYIPSYFNAKDAPLDEKQSMFSSPCLADTAA
jgi:hypothetical protein